MRKSGSVYIMSSVSRRTLYTGVTSNLEGRVWEHMNKQFPNSFTSRYNCILLVYYKHFENIEDAIAEEKRLKGCSRAYKDQLINTMNNEWLDLSDKISYELKLE